MCFYNENFFCYTMYYIPPHGHKFFKALRRTSDRINSQPTKRARVVTIRTGFEKLSLSRSKVFDGETRVTKI